MGVRAQANLPALAAALLLLTATTGVGLTLADGAFGAATRQPGERATATALAERLVGPSSPLTTRTNVLDDARLTNLDTAALRTQFPVVEDWGVRVRIDDRSVVTHGNVDGGTTIRRVVLIERRQERRLTPDLRGEPSVTLPRRTSSVEVTLSPSANVSTVRLNGRVALHNASGLHGSFDLRASRFETSTLRFESPNTAAPPPGSVTLRFRPGETTKAVLAVTVDG